MTPRRVAESVPPGHVRRWAGIPGILLAALFLLTATGCSRVSLVYNTADFFIEQYADDYLALDSAQMATWRPTLAEALARHRQDELPYLAAFFAGLHRGATNGFDESTVECLLDAFEQAYRRHFRLAAGLAAPLLASLRPDQVRALERKFAKDNADEVKEDRAGVERRDRKRAERWAESAEWWIGPVTKHQESIIRDITAAMPDTAADWTAYRTAKQAGLIRLLKAGAKERQIRDYLVDWLADYRDLPPQLDRARREIRRQIVVLFMRIDASLSAAQRAHFQDRVAGLRDDFLDLQDRPRMTALACAPGR